MDNYIISDSFDVLWTWFFRLPSPRHVLSEPDAIFQRLDFKLSLGTLTSLEQYQFWTNRLVRLSYRPGSPDYT